MKTRAYIVTLISIILLLLWIPVSLDKLAHFQVFKAGILRQPFSDSLGQVLVYTLLPLEILTAICIVIGRFRLVGFGLSSLLMAAFTGYIGVALLGAWEKLPCGCGSVISGMSWTQHFWFNLFFLALSVLGYYLQRSLHRNSGSGPIAAEGLSAKRQHKNIFTNILNLKR
ncbi:MauE/DoxX family redox-associated membrane protein [Sphingobacterium wenxiniae]|uniref:Methylamine utilisation protein MauE n=1 Tax=Sphingobacterium wenxiniae TaxID=683125 RepID=A0A1I6VQ71_9SPHI|nr:MauE/DoxX family redox-associated membrane protein [Sphingobacterium wenxiniae]SFT15885.1 Methylamine utilisation protein MauE [Sphingobacterium wenxiniae]